MRFRNLLVVNSSKAIRGNFKRMILSEMDDVLVFEAANADEAVMQLEKQKFDAVLASKELPGMSGLELFQNREVIAANRDTPYIIISTTHTGENIQEIISAGAKHYMVFPFSPRELAAKIDTVVNVRKWRVYERYSIPSTSISGVLEGGVTFEGDVINISYNGILASIAYSPECCIMLNGPADLTLRFHPNYYTHPLEGFHGKLLRLKTEQHQADGSPTRLRAVWHVSEIDVHQKQVLGEVFSKYDNIIQSW